jgi:hypothetical protein
MSGSPSDPNQPNSAQPPQWARGMTPPQAVQFEELLRAELLSHGLEFSGDLPQLVDPAGQAFYVGNLAQTCAAAQLNQWQGIIREYLDTFEAVNHFVSIGPDVAKMSLRLRLLDLQPGNVDSATDSPTGLDILRASVNWPASPGLHWVLYVRRNEAGQNVLPEHLESWGITRDEAWQLAKDQTLANEVGELNAYDDMSAYIGNSMFTTTSLLKCHRWLPDSPKGVFVSVPNRHHVMVRKVDAEGAELLTNFFQLTQDTFDDGPYPLSRNVWWVSPTGPGEHGELAEQITPMPVTDNPDGITRFILMPGPRLLKVLADL